MGLQAVEQSETIHRVEDACICSSLHIQGTFIYTDTHRCPLHNDTMEHDCTSKNIVPGLIVPSDERLDTPQPVEDRCICSSLHIHGSSVNVCCYHRCSVHNDTMEHDCMHANIVTGQTNFIRFDELPETINTPQPVEDACTCSTLHIQGKQYKSTTIDVQYTKTCTEEHTDYTRRNTVIGQGQ